MLWHRRRQCNHLELEIGSSTDILRLWVCAPAQEAVSFSDVLYIYEQRREGEKRERMLATGG